MGVEPEAGPPRRLPPGQYLPRGWPVLHYGRVPRTDLETWDFRVLGATNDGGPTTFNYQQFMELPQARVDADFHCVTKFSLLNNEWEGVLASQIASLCPPDGAVTHVMLWAEFGYSANLRIEDFLAADAIFAHSRNGEPLTAEHGWPLRFVCPHLYAWKSAKWVRAVEYMVGDRRGFWEDRGYHNRGSVWAEERYSYQEAPGDGPPLAAPGETG